MVYQPSMTTDQNLSEPCQPEDPHEVDKPEDPHEVDKPEDPQKLETRRSS